ncbi:MAG: SDR family oxidoreductase, partial [Chitinispirillia bacterium]
MDYEAMLSGKSALITGSGRGIGKEIALSLGKRGVKVACCSRSESELTEVTYTILKSGGTAYYSALDVQNIKQLEKFCTSIKKNIGALDFVIVNAGISSEKCTIEESDPDKWKTAIGINLIGAYNTVKAAIPLLKESTAGKIIFIGSGLGRKGFPGTSSYSCSKAGLWML